MTVEKGIYGGRIIHCYVCSGEPECGISFSSNLTNNTEHRSKHGNELLYSCSVSDYCA
jgi:hypothetical protein